MDSNVFFCNPAAGWEKGGVEVMNKVLRKRLFVPPPPLHSEKEYNAKLNEHFLAVQMKEIHYKKKIQKSELWEQERKAGHAVKEFAFDTRQTVHRTTDKCALIRVDGVRYGVTDKHARTSVTAKLGAFTVDIYDKYGTFICTHPRSYVEGETIIKQSLYADAYEARPRACVTNGVEIPKEREMKQQNTKQNQRRINYDSILKYNNSMVPTS